MCGFGVLTSFSSPPLISLTHFFSSSLLLHSLSHVHVSVYTCVCMCVCARVRKGTSGSKTAPGFHQVVVIEGQGVDHGQSLWAVKARACSKVQLRVAAEAMGMSKGTTRVAATTLRSKPRHVKAG